MAETVAPRLLAFNLPEGEDVPEGLARAGDFLLVHVGGPYGVISRLGQRLRIHGQDKQYARWNHAAMVINDGGEIVEALLPGVREGHVSKYRDRQATLVKIVANTEDRRQAAYFAWCQVGARYGYLTILSLVLSLLTGAKLSFNVDGEFICSGLVARALERTGAMFDRDPAHMTPADLACVYKVPYPWGKE